VLTDLIGSGRLVPTSGAHYPLAEGARALRELAGRRTVGRVALIVGPT
jgi:NADPH:quinone reductase-like Zn-dependent oxidoreductase